MSFPGELKIIVVDNNKKSETLLKGISEGRYKIDLIVTMEKPSDSVSATAAEAGVKVITFEDMEAAGKENLQEFVVCIMRTCHKTEAITKNTKKYMYTYTYHNPH